jgi:hypothetical protein
MSVCAVFFGGFQATQDHVNKWRESARKLKPGIEFGVRPWPSGAWNNKSGPAGVSAFRETGEFDSLVAALKASPADKIYIVGHSSGCAIANAVDKEITKGLKDPSKFVLVCLDGFRPDADQLSRANTQVCGAVFGVHKSYNYPDDDEKRQLGKHFKEYTANASCTKEFALHFSLVNTIVTNDTGNIKDGYKDCHANLKFVDDDLALKTP